ncbi:TetR family transcriptional regulator [Streptomyces lasiicapitis]|uniref:TetR/AcrR family transcriptional regulator n=1 Tax=Streptomyces lasiicapitis TaxID=1923961 RepID=UPI0033311596
MSETTQSASAPVGRRERKKAATRQALADAALNLFLQHGYDAVGIRDVADAADVSTTTLFKHFPVKEALVFDEDADQEAKLLAAVRERAEGQSIPAALREHALLHRVRSEDDEEGFAAFFELIENTPALRAYAQNMWLRHEASLAHVIADETNRPADDPDCAALAHFTLEATRVAHGRSDARTVVTRAFDLLEHGWAGITARD